MKFRLIRDGHDEEVLEARSKADAASQAASKVKPGETFALTGPRGGAPSFYLRREGAVAYPISASTAAFTASGGSA